MLCLENPTKLGIVARLGLRSFHLAALRNIFFKKVFHSKLNTEVIEGINLLENILAELA
jgi:hypothetical protein